MHCAVALTRHIAAFSLCGLVSTIAVAVNGQRSLPYLSPTCNIFFPNASAKDMTLLITHIQLRCYVRESNVVKVIKPVDLSCPIILKKSMTRHRHTSGGNLKANCDAGMQRASNRR
jgi:hypothetical protein